LLTDIFADVAHGQKMYPKYRMTHTCIFINAATHGLMIILKR